MLPNYERFLAYDLACRGFYEIFRKKNEEKLDLNNRGSEKTAACGLGQPGGNYSLNRA